MKKILLTAAAGIIVAGSAYAGDIGKCEKIGELAGGIMTLRQLNTKMSKVINKLGPESPFVSIVIKAYETPLYSTEKYKKREIMKFENMYYIECLKHERNK